MRQGPLDSPFDVAWRQATRRGACPLEELEGSLFDCWDVPTLCGAFPCAECVAEPGDWESAEPPSEPAPIEDQDLDLPF